MSPKLISSIINCISTFGSYKISSPVFNPHTADHRLWQILSYHDYRWFSLKYRSSKKIIISPAGSNNGTYRKPTLRVCSKTSQDSRIPSGWQLAEISRTSYQTAFSRSNTVSDTTSHHTIQKSHCTTHHCHQISIAGPSRQIMLSRPCQRMEVTWIKPQKPSIQLTVPVTEEFC